MKRILETLRMIIICLLLTAMLGYALIGAVLQESYKNCPVTAEEIARK